MSTIIYNGFRPNERRERSHRLKASDKGHSVRRTWQLRKGDTFSFTYGSECQCGKVFTGQTSTRPFYSYLAHLRREGVE